MNLVVPILLGVYLCTSIMIQSDNEICIYPREIDCPPLDYCPNATSIVIEDGSSYYCTAPLNISADIISIGSGNYTGGLNLKGTVISMGNISCEMGSVVVEYSEEVTLDGQNSISDYLVIWESDSANNSQVSIASSIIACKKMLIVSQTILITDSMIDTIEYSTFCFYEIVNISVYNSYSQWTTRNFSVLSSPINIVMVSRSLLSIKDSLINTTVISIYSIEEMEVEASVINASASSCRTNMGMGKGLEVQLRTRNYCCSGGSSAGYGVLSDSSCNNTIQYFMFLSHSFPYLSKGPNLATGSGGYGYITSQGKRGAGGGIIFLYSASSLRTQSSLFLADGGDSSGNNYYSSGSGGTIFIYSQNMTGGTSLFSAKGGASYNTNGSGSGGIIKISYNNSLFVPNDSMQINISQGFQTNSTSSKYRSNGIFYGTICAPGDYIQNLNCIPCSSGHYSLLGDPLCHPCPKIDSFWISLNSQNTSGLTQISQCFVKKGSTFNEIWLQPNEVQWLYIVLYVIYLFVAIVVGLIIKKKYKKKLSLMETDEFSLEDSKKDSEETQLITMKLKSEKNIHFEDLLYHIHRITLFGSNTPQCPWALPSMPPQPIRRYILRQGFIDFASMFNKVAKWSNWQKLQCIVSKLIYPLYWFLYDRIKKKKYHKLLSLLQQSKEFNLINNYDFEDKDMVTIKISKNTDYTICYLDFMVYDRADLKYFNLTSPFVISLSGEGNFLRPFYLEDRDVFFNCLFYIINRTKEKMEEAMDEKLKLFSNLVTQKKRQENYAKLIEFLKNFNKISITLDLSAPLSLFINELISLIVLIKTWNHKYFNDLGISMDLILMISALSKGNIFHNDIHILTYKDENAFRDFMEETIPNMNKLHNFDLKLGLFVYNPEQQIKNAPNRSSGPTKNWTGGELGVSEDEDFEEPLVESEENMSQKKIRFQPFSKILRLLHFVRFYCFSHRKLDFDKNTTRFVLAMIILWQAFLIFVWSIWLQFPYVGVNLISPFVGLLWMVSGSYGVGKLFLILNAMTLLNQTVELIISTAIDQDQQIALTIICQGINIFFDIIAIFFGCRLISVSRKLSTSKMFK